MSNIYKALEQAQAEKTNVSVSKQLSVPSRDLKDVEIQEEMVWLHQQVDNILGGTHHKLIQFISAGRGEGVSTIVREFAKIAAERYGKTVLVLDSSYNDPTQKVNLNITCELGWLDLLDKEEFVEKALFRFGESNLYFAPITFEASFATSVKDIPSTTNLWMKLKTKFDLILIDSSSEQNNFDHIILSRNADGVVLVIEAEKSKRRTVKKFINKVSSQGGKLLGVVLNKRKYYVPKVVNKLFLVD